MSVQRLSDSQFTTDIPTRNAVEAVWHAFSQFGLNDVVIDSQKWWVTGTKGMSLSSYGKTYIAVFESHPAGLIISLRGEEAVNGVIDFGRGKKQLAELASLVQSQLQRAEASPQEYSNAVEAAPAKTVAPIPLPVGGPTSIPINTGKPVYGLAAVPRRGPAVLMYGIFGLFCCFHITSIFALIYGAKALQEYKTQDPGDKVMVYIGMGLGVIGCCLMLLRPIIRNL